MDKNNTNYRGVQALRGLAALSVMCFHFRWNLNDVTPDLGNKLFGWGATGVDLFFLISGFVITLSITRTPSGFHSALQFLKNRALRILPAYYIILVLTFLLSGAMSTFHYADKTENLISAIFFKPIYPDHAPFYVDDSGMYGIRWTLNYEIYFYLVMSLMVLFNKRLIITSVYFLVSLIAIPLSVWGHFSLNPLGYEVSSALLGLVTNPIIFLFLAGMVLGLLIPYIQKVPVFLSVTLLLLSVIACAYSFSHGRFVGHGFMDSGWLYFLVLMFAAMSEKCIGKLVPKALIGLGNISFSVYLIHPLLNAGIGKRMEELGIGVGWERFLLSILISLVLGWVSWRYIEKGFIRARQVRKHAME